jgi:hypothetical protein
MMIRCPRRSRVAILTVALALLGTAACSTSSKVEDSRPLPTTSVSGELACEFLSKESLSIALGTTDFRSSGTKVNLNSGKNPDGSTLSQAACRAYTSKEPGREAVSVSVQPLGLSPRDDAIVANTLASGHSEYTFPAAEGMGFGASDETLHVGAGTCDLIVGDWHYGVTIKNSVAGRNAVDDAVALTRQVVATLGLPKVGTKPRPTAAPAK